MKRTKFYAIRSMKTALLLIGAVLISGGGVGAGQFSTNERNSPDPTLNPNARHILINSNHGKSNTLDLKVYYPSNLTLNSGDFDQIVIYDPGLYGGGNDRSTKCTILKSVTYNTKVLTMTGSINNNAWSGELGSLNANQLCQNAANPNVYPGTTTPYSNVKGGIYPIATNSFHIPWNVVNTAQVNPASGMKEVTVSFKLTDVGGYHNPTNGDSGEITASFEVASVYGRLASTMGNGAPNNGMVPRQGGGPDGPMNITYSFGMPCDQQTNNNPVLKTINLYDLDSSQTGFFVQEEPYGSGTWNTLPYGRYSSPTGVSGWDNGYQLWRAADADHSNSTVNLYVYPKNKYRVIITGLKRSADVQSLFNNYIFVGVPGDTIFGLDSFICPNYNLTPGVSVSPTMVEAGGSVTVNGWVNYDGNISAGNHQWLVREHKTLPASEGGGSTSRDIMPNTTSAFPPNQSWNTTLTIPYTDKPGTKYCYETFVLGSSLYDGNWKSSGQMCTVVGVKPKTQFWGYDVRSGGKVAGSTSNIGGKTYGSWGEYGVLSTLPNSNVGSGSGPVNGVGGTNGGTSLTFANTNTPRGCGASYGCYGSQNFPTDTVNRLKPATCGSGNVTVPATPYSASPPPICTTGTVTIEGNITYDPGTATVSDGRFAQQVILAKDIVIKAGVTRVDAWLVTQDENGIVSTCATDNSGEAGKLTPANARLHAGICNQPLKINGPVIAGKLYLYRTHYNSTEPGEPAEIINLRPDAFLAAYTGTGSTPYVQTQNVIELPPRL